MWKDYIDQWCKRHNFQLGGGKQEPGDPQDRKFFIEVLERNTGETWVYVDGRLGVLSSEFFKYGNSHFDQEISFCTSSALAAATAFPLLFSPSVQSIMATSCFEDAGSIDNLGLLPFFKILENRYTNVGTAHEEKHTVQYWLVSDADRPMPVPEDSWPYMSMAKPEK